MARNDDENAVEIVADESRVRNAWIVLLGDRVRLNDFSVTAIGKPNDRAPVAGRDGLMVVRKDMDGHKAVAFARVYRVRVMADATTFCFEGIVRLDSPRDLASLGMTPPGADAPISRLDWSPFENALKTATGIDFAGIPVIKGEFPREQAYIRDLLQFAMIDDILGPASGPEEEIVGMSVRDRYLVGKLAPRTTAEDECIEGLQGPAALDEGVGDGESPTDLRPFEEVGSGRDKGGRRRVPGEEFATAAGDGDPDDDESKAVDASKNQSVVPSSLGLTVCVDAAVETLDAEVRWGRYVRTTSEEQTSEEGKPMRAWKRIPSGGKVSLSMRDGQIKPVAPDPDCPQVVIQGTVRPPLASAERLVTIFLVNDQPKPDQNQDEAWLFQPELILRHPENEAVFRRRPLLEDDDRDPERSALEMIYRRRVEFAVGHGVSVHAETSTNVSDRAVEVRTAVLPQYEVAITETPGLAPGDRPALRRMADEGFLDMRELARTDRADLIAALAILTDDYEAWIGEQRARSLAALPNRSPRKPIGARSEKTSKSKSIAGPMEAKPSYCVVRPVAAKKRRRCTNGSRSESKKGFTPLADASRRAKPHWTGALWNARSGGSWSEIPAPRTATRSR